jgi:hypothetical protein
MAGLILLLSQSVLAAPNCDEDPACRPVVSRAREFSRAGQLDDALLSYQAAYRITADPRILFNVARIYHKQTRLLDAKAYYQRFLDSGYEEESLRAKSQEYLAQIEAAPAQELEPPPAALHSTALTSGNATVDASPKPIYKRPWFWVVIGTVVAGGVAGGVAAGVLVSQRPPAAPDGVPTFRIFLP